MDLFGEIAVGFTNYGILVLWCDQVCSVCSVKSGIIVVTESYMMC